MNGSKARYAVAPLPRMTAGPDPTLSKAIFVPSLEVTVCKGCSYLQMIMNMTPEAEGASARADASFRFGCFYFTMKDQATDPVCTSPARS